MRYFPRRDVCFLCRYSCRTFRTVHRPADAELCGKFRTDNFCVCTGTAGGAGLFQLFPQGRGTVEYAGAGSSAPRYADDRIGQLYPEYFVAGHGGHPLRRYHQYAGAGCGTADIEANGAGSQYAGFGMCRGISAGGSGRYFCRADNTQGIGA